MAIGDFFKLTLEAEYYSEDVQNVFFYEQQSAFAGNPAQALATAFETVVLAAMSQIQVTLVAYKRVLAQNLITVTENYEILTPTPANGTEVGGGAPPLIAMSFRSTRPDLSQRYSYKRIGGIPISWITGENWNATSEPESGALATAMATVLSPGFGDFKPIQLRVQYVLGSPVYTRNYQIGEYVKQSLVTTQNSRKEGHGG